METNHQRSRKVLLYWQIPWEYNQEDCHHRARMPLHRVIQQHKPYAGRVKESFLRSQTQNQRTSTMNKIFSGLTFPPLDINSSASASSSFCFTCNTSCGTVPLYSTKGLFALQLDHSGFNFSAMFNKTDDKSFYEILTRPENDSLFQALSVSNQLSAYTNLTSVQLNAT